MTITPSTESGACRTGHLVKMTVKKISIILGFPPNIEDDPYKVKYSWGFKADGKRCGIWDYKGSEKWGEFSTYGPDEVFKTLFGDNYGRY